MDPVLEAHDPVVAAASLRVHHRVLGWFGGKIDEVYYSTCAMFAGKQRARLFSKGWGDPSDLFVENDRLMARIRAGESVLDAPVAILFESEDDAAVSTLLKPDVPMIARAGHFSSPAAALLPAEARTVHLMYVSDAAARLPWHASKAAPVQHVVLMLPATNEQTYTDRVHLAQALIAHGHKHGTPTACILLMAPFYGTRRPTGQIGCYIDNVRDYLAQSLSLMLESAGIIGWAHMTAPAARIVVTGFSWGAAMSAAAAMLSLSVLPHGVSARLAVVPYVGSMSPTPLVDGVLANDIDWEVLTRHHGGDAAATKDRLRALLVAASSQNIVDALAAAPDVRLIGSLHSVGMLHDGFVKNRDCSALHSMLSPMTRPARARMDWFAGGHVVAYMYKRSVQVQAVLSALAQLDL